MGVTLTLHYFLPFQNVEMNEVSSVTSVRVGWVIFDITPFAHQLPLFSFLSFLFLFLSLFPFFFFFFLTKIAYIIIDSESSKVYKLKNERQIPTSLSQKDLT
jgi:hypothetical protein